MLVNFNQVLKSLNGQDDLKNEKGESLSLADLSKIAILNDNSKQIDGKKKYQRYELARKIESTPDAVELTAEDIATIKECAANLFAPLTYGRVVDAFENKKVV